MSEILVGGGKFGFLPVRQMCIHMCQPNQGTGGVQGRRPQKIIDFLKLILRYVFVEIRSLSQPALL